MAKKKVEEQEVKEEEQVEETEEEVEEEEEQVKEIRMAFLYGELDDENCEDLYKDLILLMETTFAFPDKKQHAPFKLYLNTEGGHALYSFGICDIIRNIRHAVPVHTTAVGQVMSAGVPILACGTKGERRISRNCRVMIHGAQGGLKDYVSRMRADLKEFEELERIYVDLLVSETNLDRKKLVRLLKESRNHYYSAEEAVQMGIADIII